MIHINICFKLRVQQDTVFLRWFVTGFRQLYRPSDKKNFCSIFNQLISINLFISGTETRRRTEKGDRKKTIPNNIQISHSNYTKYYCAIALCLFCYKCRSWLRCLLTSVDHAAWSVPLSPPLISAWSSLCSVINQLHVAVKFLLTAQQLTEHRT